MLQALNRRGVLASLIGGIAAMELGPLAAGAAPARLPTDMTLLVAGPPGSPADRWADLLTPGLGRILQQGAVLNRQNVGGADGVTAANQFEARAAPDGSTALLVPGLAALSWLTGDARVQFDAAHWIPVWGGVAPAVLASRVRLGPGQRVRFAVSNTVGPELAGLLALDLLGAEVVPVRGAPGSPNVPNPEVDAVVLQGAAIRSAGASGMGLAFTLGTLTAAGETVRDPLFPDLPTAREAVLSLQPGTPAPLLEALRALSSAAQLGCALALPQLSPAALVAWWRRGCAELAQSPELQAEAALSGLRPVSPAMAGVTLGAITTDVPVLLDLRRWLSSRPEWRPV